MFRRGSVWWTTFWRDGKKVNKSLDTTDEHEARTREEALKEVLKQERRSKDQIQEVLGGKWEVNRQGPQSEPKDEQAGREITVNSVWKRWKMKKENGLKPSTLHRWESIANRIFLPAFGSTPIIDITDEQLEDLFAARGKEVSPKTVINEMCLLKLIFKSEKKLFKKYQRDNPAADLESPKYHRRRIEILTPKELDELIKHADNHYRLAFKTDALTGLRAGELWGLRWDNVQFTTNQIFVRQSVWGGKFQEPKTPNAIRNIDIPEELVGELKRWKLACPPNDNNLVFPSPEGEISQHDNVVHRYFNSALIKAGLRHVSFHSLRHSNASIRIRKGQNIKYISAQMGHASVAFTLDIYGHLFDDPEFLRSQGDLLNGVLGTSGYSLGTVLEQKKVSQKRLTH